MAGLSVGAAAYVNANAAAPAASTYSAAAGSQSTTGGVASNDTPVTGTELANVKAAVTAKDSTVTVTEVRKDPDGSYDVIGTKAGAGDARGQHGPQDHHREHQRPQVAVTAA